MNAIAQLEQTTTQICGGIQNVVIPKPQLNRESDQFVSGRSSNLDFPSCLSNVLTLSPNPSAIQTKETFLATNAAIGILISGLADTFAATTKRDSKFTLDHIDIGSRILLFAKPIIADVSFDDNMYSCKSEDLGIISMSAKWEDCVKDFKDEVLFIWNEYGKENDTRLTNDAKELKRRILSHLKQ